MTRKKNNIYMIDYKTGIIVYDDESFLKETYIVCRPKANYFCTENNKMIVLKENNQETIQRYYKLFSNGGEPLMSIEDGDIIRDSEDFIYRVHEDDDGEFYCETIGDIYLY